MDQNEFDLHGTEPAGGTHFRMNGFTSRLVLAQLRRKAIKKWPIVSGPFNIQKNKTIF